MPLDFRRYDFSKQSIAESCPRLPSAYVHMLSAVVAGALGNVVVNPLWVVKTRLQTQIFTHTNEGFFKVFFEIYSTEGFKAYYKGLNASLLGLSHVAIQFPLYEHIKSMCKVRRRGGEETFADLLFSSVSAKTLACTVTYPHEVVRARLQVTHGSMQRGIVGQFLKILREEGIRGLYSGFTVNLVRIAPATATTFLSYEYISRYLRKREEERLALRL